jgi:hypothetical protein
MLRRVTLGAIGLAGLVMILLTLVFGMWGKSAAVHGLVNSFKPGYQPAAMAQSTSDFKTVSAMATQLQTQALPGLAAALKVTPTQLSTSLATNYPAVGKGIAEMPAALAWFGNLATRIGGQAADFQKAETVPVKGLAATTVPWMFVIPGALLVIAALLGLARPVLTTKVAILGAVIGVFLIVFPLVVNMPAKSSAVSRLVTAFRPVMTAPGPQKTANYVSVMSAMSAQFSTGALPGLAKELHMTTPAVEKFLATKYPAVGQGFAQLPSILPRFRAMSTLIDSQVANYAAAENMPWRGAPPMMLYWFLAVPGLLMLLGGGGQLVFGKPKEETEFGYGAVVAS